MGLTRTVGMASSFWFLEWYSYILMENSCCSLFLSLSLTPYELGKGYLRRQSRTVNISGEIFRLVSAAALRIFGQFGGQIVPHSPLARLNTEDNPCGLLRYHVGPYVLTGGCPRTSYLYAVEYTYVFVSHGFSMETLARGRACCDTLIPKSVAISPRYNK